MRKKALVTNIFSKKCVQKCSIFMKKLIFSTTTSSKKVRIHKKNCKYNLARNPQLDFGGGSRTQVWRGGIEAPVHRFRVGGRLPYTGLEGGEGRFLCARVAQPGPGQSCARRSLHNTCNDPKSVFEALSHCKPPGNQIHKCSENFHPNMC